jgi:hypothetical protein
MFKFELKLPFIHIYTELLNKNDYHRRYNYVIWHIQIYKWYCQLEWGK